MKFYSEKHDPGGAMHFGWIEYEGATPGDPLDGEVIGWGYETEPNTAISACECRTRGPIIPEPSPIPSLNPLGLLILAGLILAGGGVAMSRKKREDA